MPDEPLRIVRFGPKFDARAAAEPSSWRGRRSRDTVRQAAVLVSCGRWRSWRAPRSIRQPAGAAAAALHAEILVDRHGWRLDPPQEALSAVRALKADDPRLAAFLTAHLAYWKQIFGLPDDVGEVDVVATFDHTMTDARLTGWAVFYRSVALQHLTRDLDAAAAGFEATLTWARKNDHSFLESYALRHQGELMLGTDRDHAVGQLRRSLNLRAALGTRPQIAAAQATLAGALGGGGEAEELRQLSARTAAELSLTWLLAS